MSQIIPIYIPTLISDINFNPAKVYPRLYFYNGKIDCEPYYFERKASSGSAIIVNTELTAFPYVDHYNVVTGSFPTDGSKSLLFQNEEPVYGSSPSSSLYSEYWETYINLLYNPLTRLINCKGIIPLADYYKMELNDIVEWRGNSYHLRAINDYNLKTGKCDIQLLGPIIKDTFGIEYDCTFTFNSVQNATPTTTLTPTTLTPTTLVPTTTTLTPISCFAYQYGPAQASCQIFWRDCDRNIQSTFVTQGNYYSVPCMQENTGQGCGPWVKGASCDTTTTTLTPTVTPTTTIAPTFLSVAMEGATSGSFTSGSQTWGFISFTNTGSTSANPTLNVFSGTTSNNKLLLIGGGGAGGWDDNTGNDSSGGGGAGQVLFVNNVNLSSGSYGITIGAGGAAPTAGNKGGNGTTTNASSINAAYAVDFGAGGGASTPNNDGRASVNGSGGGGAETGTGGFGGQSSGGNSNAQTGGGGGGGASANGAVGTSNTGGNGGAGLTFTGLTNTSLSVGGGGAGTGVNTQGTATDGGGGAGTAGTDGTGGGGGGSRLNNPGKGGGGRFILTYQIA